MSRAWLWWVGMSVLLLAVIVWVTIDTVHDGQLPDLAHLGEFLGAGGAILYGIDRASKRPR